MTLRVRKGEWGQRRGFWGDQCENQRMRDPRDKGWLSGPNEGKRMRSRVGRVKVAAQDFRVRRKVSRWLESMWQSDEVPLRSSVVSHGKKRDTLVTWENS